MSSGYTFGQLEQFWISAGGPQAIAPVMAAIALAESNGDPNAHNLIDNNGTQSSWGLWQISDGTHRELPGWSDPAINARMAVQKYFSQGLGAWGTYTSGAYKQFLHGAQSAVSDATGGAIGGASGSGGHPVGPDWAPQTKRLVTIGLFIVLLMMIFGKLGHNVSLPARSHDAPERQEKTEQAA